MRISKKFFAGFLAGAVALSGATTARADEDKWPAVSGQLATITLSVDAAGSQTVDSYDFSTQQWHKVTFTWNPETKELHVSAESSAATLPYDEFTELVAKFKANSADASIIFDNAMMLPEGSGGLFWGWQGQIIGTEKLNTSKVTNMDSMFDGVTNANPNVANWDTSKVTSMIRMFADATKANPDVTNWDVRNVNRNNNAGFLDMFKGATSATPSPAWANTAIAKGTAVDSTSAVAGSLSSAFPFSS
ncbi:MAG: BspA family leucine-rich repeat surface protein [Corynebacterium sp.]|nr:BspA family leucine-rich repeat surface protein [Corynebacterium sp.]